MTNPFSPIVSRLLAGSMLCILAACNGQGPAYLTSPSAKGGCGFRSGSWVARQGSTEVSFAIHTFIDGNNGWFGTPTTTTIGSGAIINPDLGAMVPMLNVYPRVSDSCEKVRMGLSISGSFTEIGILYSAEFEGAGLADSTIHGTLTLGGYDPMHGPHPLEGIDSLVFRRP